MNCVNFTSFTKEFSQIKKKKSGRGKGKGKGKASEDEFGYIWEDGGEV